MSTTTAAIVVAATAGSAGGSAAALSGVGTGLTAGKFVALGIGIPVAIAAGVYAGHQIANNPKARSATKLVLGAALFSPMLAAEDILRAAGADIPKEGVFCNNEGKSIWQIWNESAAK